MMRVNILSIFSEGVGDAVPLLPQITVWGKLLYFIPITCDFRFFLWLPTMLDEVWLPIHV